MVGWVSAIDVIADDLGVERLHIGGCQDKVDFFARFISFEDVESPDIVCIWMQHAECIDHRDGIFNIGVVLAGHSGLALQELNGRIVFACVEVACDHEGLRAFAILDAFSQKDHALFA